MKAPTSKYLKHPSPTGRTFEYTVRNISPKDWEIMNQDDTLNKFGDGGWELCTFSTVQMQEGEVYQLIFKREKK